MDRETYLQELRLRLSHRMREPELSRTVGYYEAYFDEAGPEGAQGVIQELGPPEELVRRIMGDKSPMPAAEAVPEERKSGLGAMWTMILAICAAPLAIPLTVGLLAVAAALVFAVLVLVAGLGAAGVLCVGFGVMSAVCGFSAVLTHGVATTMYFVGGGMAAAGVGILLIAGVLSLAGLCFRGIARLLGRALEGRGRTV